MPETSTASTSFRRRFIAGERLIGTFIKTPATHPVEIIGAVGFEFVVIDEEHAPWDRVAIDGALLAARAAGTAGIVRVAEPTAAKILSVLDDGATGVLVPHVSSAAKAREIAAACRYRGGRRGFSNTHARRRFRRGRRLGSRRRAGRQRDLHRHDRGPGSARRDRGDRFDRWPRRRLHRPRRPDGGARRARHGRTGRSSTSATGSSPPPERPASRSP